MSQSPFYLEHYLDSLETLPGELRRNFTKMTDKDQVLKKDLVQIDSTSDEYLRKVRDLSPTKRKAEMEKIQVSCCDVGWLLVVDHGPASDWAVKGAPGVPSVPGGNLHLLTLLTWSMFLTPAHIPQSVTTQSDL